MSAGNVVVYGGWSTEGIADFSPFCLKVKTYLRMTGVPYTPKSGPSSSTGPSGVG